MARGAYDTTDPSAYKSSVAMAAINMHESKRAADQTRSDAKQAELDMEKVIRSKKSRGILAAKKAAKDEAARTTKTESSEDSDATVKP